MYGCMKFLVFTVNWQLKQCYTQYYPLYLTKHINYEIKLKAVYSLVFFELEQENCMFSTFRQYW